MNDNKRELKLSQSKDWDAWLSVVRAKATGLRIWHLIDPAINVKPIGLDEPDEPDLDDQPGSNFTEKHARFKMAATKYKRDLQDFKDQHDSMAKIISFIYDTTSINNLTYIQKVEVHPWIVLRALQSRLAPTDSARSLDMERQYARLVKGPTNRQHVDAWLDDYLKMHAMAKEIQIAEVTDAKRAYRDFLQAIEKIAPTFAEVYELQLDTVIDFDAQIYLVVDKFRNHMRMKEAKQGRSTSFNSAFATDKGNSNNSSRNSSRTPSFRGENQDLPTCICGKNHWYADCFYLNKNKRPPGFKLYPDIQKKIDEALKNDDTKKKVEHALTRNKEITRKRSMQKDDDHKPSESSPSEMGSFITVRPGTFAGQSDDGNYYLRSSWIMDTGSAMHIANDTMKHRFIKDRDCVDGSTILSGGGPLSILAYGRIKSTCKRLLG